MADKDYKAFIVEGEAREPQVIDNISKVFLFFDYDAHQTNLGKSDDDDVINQMLESFDNETENGKLYISYALCQWFICCEISLEKVI